MAVAARMLLSNPLALHPLASAGRQIPILVRDVIMAS